MRFSLPHWLAFWAVGELIISFYYIFRSMFAGFKWSIVEYSWKIERLFAKMEGMRTAVLPRNRAAIDDYLTSVWERVHTLTAAVLGLDYVYNPEKFQPHLDAEEARLGNNLRAVDYVIDGVDTLTLITGRGRIEKVRLKQTILHHLELTSVLRLSFRCYTCW
jgi:hypothetical protein